MTGPDAECTEKNAKLNLKKICDFIFRVMGENQSKIGVILSTKIKYHNLKNKNRKDQKFYFPLDSANSECSCKF